MLVTENDESFTHSNASSEFFTILNTHSLSQSIQAYGKSWVEYHAMVRALVLPLSALVLMHSMETGCSCRSYTAMATLVKLWQIQLKYSIDF